MGRLVLAVLALVACSDSSGPSLPEIAGRYELATVDGEAVPYEWPEVDGLVVRLLGSSIQVMSDVTVRRTTEWETWDEDAAIITEQTDTEILFIEWSDQAAGELRLVDEDGYPDYAVNVEAGRLRFWESNGDEWIYER